MICQGCGKAVKILHLHHWYDLEKTPRLQQKHICSACNVALGYQFGPEEFSYPSWEEQLEFLKQRLKPPPDMHFPYKPGKTIDRVNYYLGLGLNPSQIARRLGISHQRVSTVILAARKQKGRSKKSYLRR